jgi:N-acetylmuramoyl-L-alanine amidase
VFRVRVPFQTTTRRQALGLGATAFAAALLRSPAAALARPAVFELDLTREQASAAGGWRTTKVILAPRRFDLIGLRWARGSSAEVEVRARRRRGEWTPWVKLHTARGHGPDHSRAPAGTDPAFTGTADEFQLRLRGNPRALRARFVRALPTATAAQRLSERLRRRSSARASRRGQAAGPSVRIITRSEWGGDSVPPRTAPEYGQVQLAFVHHTATANDYAPADSAGIVLGIARYHRDSNGWNDIGYNFLVDKYGQVFEGRAGGIDAPVVGAQAQGYNSVSTGVACLGTFTQVPQGEAGMDALARLVGWKLSVHGVPVQGQVTVTSAGGPDNRYPAGTPVTFERISGHRDGDSTSCPGDVLYDQLRDLRIRAAAFAGPLASLTMHTSRTVRGVKPSAVSGELRFADGSSAGGAPVDVEFQAAGSAWTRVAGAVCGSDGLWRTSIELPYGGKVRAVFPGDATRPRLESAPVTVRVLTSLVLSVVARRVRRRRAVPVSGSISPAEPRVTVVFERRVARRWVRVQRKRIQVRDGAFSTIVRPPVPGRYRLTVNGGGITRRRRLVAG